MHADDSALGVYDAHEGVLGRPSNAVLGSAIGLSHNLSCALVIAKHTEVVLLR